MAFMRSVQMIACPFDSNQLLDRHCIDLLTKKYVPTGQDFLACKYAAYLGTLASHSAASSFVDGRE